jgi:D-alanyl-D-alanine carboxypeptidase
MTELRPLPRLRISADGHDLFVRGGGRGCAARFALHRQSDGRRVATGRLDPVRGEVRPSQVIARASERLLLALLARWPRRARWRIDRACAQGRSNRSLRRSAAAGDPERRRLERLAAGLAPGYAAATRLAAQRDRAVLHYAGLDHAGRECWLAPTTVRAWRRLATAAAADGIALQLVSGFRSRLYQARIIDAKLRRGQDLAAILRVNAAPGYSEHHLGRAIDIGTPGSPAADASFEHTAAYAWLVVHGPRLGFRLSYPRDNPHGIVFEPWHWLHVPNVQVAVSGEW